MRPGLTLKPGTVRSAWFFHSIATSLFLFPVGLNAEFGGGPSTGGPGAVFADGFESGASAGDLILELRWDTPADPDQTDHEGADLDLYLRHSLAESWEDRVWVCSWRNPNPDWGVEADPSDDPQLTLDDTDGLGPERIIMERPEPGVVYRIGAYYWADGGFGASIPSARLIWNGALAAELTGSELPGSGYFWQAWDVEFGVGEPVITEIDIVTPVTPP